MFYSQPLNYCTSSSLARLYYEVVYLTDSCPAGSTAFKSIDGKCYTIGMTRLNLNDAQQFCISQNSILAEPNLNLNDIQAFFNEFAIQFADEIDTSNTIFCFFFIS